MANLPESSTFDAGVYQLETTDPVIGGPSGVSNTPLKNLANRTKYLKDHVDAIEANFAPKASPALTGTPTAPTAATATNTTQIATTAFVKASVSADAAPAGHVGATGNAHGVATTGAAGFMSAADKSKLDGIGSGANVASVDGATGVVNLANLSAFGRSLGGNGYQRLPGGLILQWCSAEGVVPDVFDTGSKTTISVNFPIAFNQLLQVTVCHGLGTSAEAGEMAYGISGQSNTGASAVFTRLMGSGTYGTETVRAQFFAIGY